jgi:hypothetical protein
VEWELLFSELLEFDGSFVPVLSVEELVVSDVVVTLGGGAGCAVVVV